MTDFTKTPKQYEATSLISRFKHFAAYGGSRSGKTFILIYALIVRASKVKSRHLVMRRTFSSVKRAVFMDTLPKVLSICFPNLKVRYNRTDYYITLPNGSEIWFSGMDSGDRVEKILGMEFSTIYFNEASELEYSPIQIVLTRLAEKNALVKRIFYDFNPPSMLHWSYWLFIEHMDPMDDEPLANPEEYGHILMNPKDNLDNIDEEYIKLLEKMPEKERQRFLEGKFSDDTDGRAYYSFDRATHVDDSIQYVGGTKHIGMDFNVHPMTATVAGFVNGRIEIYDEAFLENSDTQKMSDHLVKCGHIGTVYPDSTGKNRKTSGKSDHQILKDNGFRIQTVHNPIQFDRVNNVNRLLSEGKLVIHPRCKKLINDLNRVSWKDNKLDQKTDPMLTHISDALGYLCWQLSPFGFEVKKKTHTQRRY